MQVYSNTSLNADILDWPVYMRQALDLARKVITTTPNPRVGCVLVKAGRVIGEGWHMAAGQPHAEVMALQQAGGDASAAIAFVTLEPCAHTGRTGPCAAALLKAGIRQVVIAGIDPNPAVAGKGVAMLEEAGVQVAHLVDFEKDAELINRGYFMRRRLGRPLVRCKLAMSLDGRTALATGESKWITGAVARAEVQLLRARSCAVVTGVGTVLQDDPALTVRMKEVPVYGEELVNNRLALARQPLRVVLDTGLRTPPGAKFARQPGAAVIYTARSAPPPGAFPESVTIKGVPAGAAGVALESVLESLASDFECNEILVEAGATLSSTFIQAGLVDELILYIAPRLLGRDGRALVEIAGIERLSDSIDFDIGDVTIVGNVSSSAAGDATNSDIRVTLVPHKKSST